MNRFAGKRALVTGGGSGIGAATVRRLAAEGAQVVVADARPGAAAEVAGDVQAVGIDVDVRDEPAVGSMVAQAIEHLGGLDVVVHCAGVVRQGTTHDCMLDDWNQVIGVNLTGTFLVIKHTLPALLAAGGGAIVTIGSVASVVAAGRSSAYDASKGGVLQLTRAVAAEYADRGIRANCVLPGLVATSLTTTSTSLLGEMTAPSSSAAGRVRVPDDRAADPNELAAVIAFLASGDASFVTGAAIAADGGYTAV